MTVDRADRPSHDEDMVVPDWIGLVLGRRRARERLAARKVARERAAQRIAAHHEKLHDALPVVPSQGDLICYNAAIHPC